MGVYYRKRIPLGKWFRINLSKNGAGLSVGKRGASISTGKRGTFLNWAIPGTGIYGRKRLSGSKAGNKHSVANKRSGWGLSWILLFVFAAVNLILGFSSSSNTAFITAGIFLVLGIVVLIKEKKSPSPSLPQGNSNPSQPVNFPSKVLLTRDMVDKLPSNESNFLREKKPLVDTILKELRTSGKACAQTFAQNNKCDADTVDAILYLLGKMGVVTMADSTTKTWTVR